MSPLPNSNKYKPVRTPAVFIARSDKITHSRNLILEGHYTVARELLESMPFNEEAKAMLRDLAQLELKQRHSVYRQRRQTTQNTVTMPVAVLLLVIGLITDGVAGFFIGRELLVREIATAFGSAFSDSEYVAWPTYDSSWVTMLPVPTAMAVPNNRCACVRSS